MAILNRSLKDDPFLGLYLQQNNLKIGRIFKLNTDSNGELTGYCSVMFLDTLEIKENVLLSFQDIGNAGFVGGFPNPDADGIVANEGQGTLCIVGLLSRDEAVVLAYIHPRIDMLRQINKFRIKENEKEFRSATGTRLYFNKDGNCVIETIEKDEQSATTSIILGKFKDVNGNLVTNNGEIVTCRIVNSKSGLLLELTENGTLILQGLKQFIESIEKLKLIFTLGEFQYSSLIANNGTGGIHSAMNHPVCFFTGAPLLGSKKFKIDD